MRLLPTILALITALGAVEGLAWWWMHPAPSGQGEPVLVYRPGDRDQVTGDREQEEAKAQTTSSLLHSTSKIASGHASQGSADLQGRERSHRVQNSSSSPSSLLHSTSKIQNSKSSLTPLPDIVARALPSLGCTTGTAARLDREDGVTIHTAFFEWDLTDSINVLEAFRHLPDECLGSIGMTLVSKEKPIAYTVGPDRRSEEEIRTSNIQRRTSNVERREEQKTDCSGASMTAALSAIGAKSERTSDSSSSSHSLIFDHTVFRDPAGVIVHAFKGTWVSGAGKLLGPGVRGGGEQWRQIRWNAALKRFRPAHARVAQGAVRGIANPDLAWQAFEQTMLADLRME